MPDGNAAIVVKRQSSAGIIRLNRPRSLNALDLDMVRLLRDAFEGFSVDPAIGTIVLEGEGERAFCAGGDIRAMAASGRTGDGVAQAFWREEYELISHLARSPKPVVALCDGIVMGGGAGLVMHLRHRIAGERVRFAMPEVGIGFLPDVGATFRLPRLPGAMGRYLAFTGEPIGTGDALALGLFDRCVPEERFLALRAELGELGNRADAAAVDRVIETYAAPPPPQGLAARRDTIAECFKLETVAEIKAALKDREGDGRDRAFAQQALETIRSRSPFSLALTQELLAAGRESETLEACLEREFGAACFCLGVDDFYEGVRAAVIDKDRNPQWASAASDWRQPGLARILEAQTGVPGPSF